LIFLYSVYEPFYRFEHRYHGTPETRRGAVLADKDAPGHFVQTGLRKKVEVAHACLAHSMEAGKGKQNLQ
jgi:hypothetical protein